MILDDETRDAFATDGELLIVRGRVAGPFGTTGGRFVLDTGAAFTTITPELADLVGYGARDGWATAGETTIAPNGLE